MRLKRINRVLLSGADFTLPIQSISRPNATWQMVWSGSGWH